MSGYALFAYFLTLRSESKSHAGSDAGKMQKLSACEKKKTACEKKKTACEIKKLLKNGSDKMKITCDYCNSVIDTETQKCCPNCGASYGGDKEIQAENERKRQMEDLNMQEQQLRIQQMQQQNGGQAPAKNTAVTALRIGCLVPLVIFGIFFIIMIICVMLDEADAPSKEKEETSRSKVVITYSLSEIDMPDIPEITGFGSGTEADTLSPVQVGNSVVCDGFTLSCESQSVTEPPEHYKTAEGNRVVLFRLVLENTGEKKYYPMNSISCLCDGYVCSRVYDSRKKDFGYDAIPTGAKAEGYFCFEVPEDGEMLTLIYDNEINLEIENKAVHTSPSD